MLDAIASEDLQAAIVKLHGNVNDDFARRGTQNFLHSVVESEPRGGGIESSFGGKPGIKFICECRRRGRFEKHIGAGAPRHYYSRDRCYTPSAMVSNITPDYAR